MNWSLQIQRVSPEDAGRYECQATTYPPQSIVIKLQVVGTFRSKSRVVNEKTESTFATGSGFDSVSFVRNTVRRLH